MTNILIALILYALVFIIGEIIFRRFKYSFLFSRKWVHVAASVVSFSLPYLVSNTVAAGIGLFFSLLLFITKKKLLFKSVHDKDGFSIGEVVYPLGLAASALIVWPISVLAYQGSCLVLGLADGFAGYLGNIYGKKNYGVMGGAKTIEGSIIFFLVTAVILYIYYFLYVQNITVIGLVLAFLCATGVTLVEALFYGGWDNLVIPITAGLTLLLIIH